MARYDLLLQGGECFTPAGLERVDCGVSDGRVVALGDLSTADAAERVDCAGLTVLPGVIDTQVHFREPGLEHKEDLETGTRGAALGGVTGIFEMPNTKPPTTTREALEDKLRRADGRAWCDYAFFVGAAEDNAEQLPELELLPGCAGVKLFMGSSTGTLWAKDDDVIAAVRANGNRRGAVQAEDEERDWPSRSHRTPPSTEGVVEAGPRRGPGWARGPPAHVMGGAGGVPPAGGTQTGGLGGGPRDPPPGARRAPGHGGPLGAPNPFVGGPGSGP